MTVKIGKEMKDGTLVLNVIHGKEMEIEYEKNEIIDKINSFFGYNCIKKVTLKIAQQEIKGRSKIYPKIKDLNKIDKKMKTISDDQLRSSLNNFLKVYNERNK